ncbi:MAG: deoR-type protein, partial [Bacteroidota bacterium]|nr:deoR-type protein [Bacteroidota bacterium]
MSNTESNKKVINKTKNIVSATILIMSVNEDIHNTNLVRERTIETALNLLDTAQKIRTITPVYKSQFLIESKNQIDTLLDYLHIGYSVGAVSRMNVDILAKELHTLFDIINSATNITLMQNNGAHIEIPDSFFDDMLIENQNENKVTEPKNNNTQTTPTIQKDISKGQVAGASFDKKTVAKDDQILKQNKQKIYISNNDKRQNRKDLILNFITEKRLDGQNDGVMIKDILGKIKDISEKTLQRELSALVAKGVLKK